jgi:5-enolpyruvylshikimate-3-phosphate synthase
MQKRPNKDLVDALRTLGAALDSTNDGYLPTTVRERAHCAARCASLAPFPASTSPAC